MSTLEDLNREGQAGQDELTRDDVFEVLSNQRRRYVLRAVRLMDEDEIDLGALAEQVAAWENDVSPRRVTYDQRKRAYTALQQTHLPKMDKAGAIQFQKNRGVVRRDSATDEFDYYLTILPGGSFLSSHYYLAGSALGLVAGLLIAVGMLRVPYVPDLAFAGFMVGLFGLAGVIHLLKRSRRLFEGESKGAPE